MWLPAGEKPDKLDMPAYMKSMLNESGKFDLAQGARNRRHPRLQQEDGGPAQSRADEDSPATSPASAT